MFILNTGIRFNGCSVCLASPASPPESLGVLFGDYFKRKVLRSSMPNVYDIMGGMEMVGRKLSKGEMVLRKEAKE